MPTGHSAGDALLRVVGHTLGSPRPWLGCHGAGRRRRVRRAASRRSASSAQTSSPSACASRCTRCILPSGPVRITVGWSAAPAGADPVSVWQRADESLYKAKRAGGDRVAGSSYEGGEAGDIAERSYTDVVTRILDGGPLNDDVPADRRSFRRCGRGLRSARTSGGFRGHGLRRSGVRGCADGRADPRPRLGVPKARGRGGEERCRPDVPLFLNISAAGAARSPSRRRSVAAAAQCRRPRAEHGRSRDHRARAHSRLRRAGARSLRPTEPRASASRSTMSARATRHSSCSRHPPAST